MTTSTATLASLSPAEQQRQLRRAVIASTVGTTIEWYDFFLYSLGTRRLIRWSQVRSPHE